MDIGKLLKEMKERNASDLILKPGRPPIMRIYGDLVDINAPPLTDDEVDKIAQAIMTEEQQRRFEKTMEMDLAVNVPGLARFRVNIFKQRRHTGIVFRLIPERIPSLDELGMPEILKKFAMRPRGLILVTGPSGCGKSTTIAAMVDYRNEHEACHIITVEDPIEFIYRNKKAIIDQREVGKDTRSFSNALKYSLRQDPDVIVVGEMRDLETISLAITAAETGHLVLSTLHTHDAVQTIDRIIDAFPPHQQRQIRLQLSANLVGIVSQILLKRADGKGMVAATEIMVSIAAVRNLIREAKTHQLPSIIQTRTKEGMRTLNMSLVELVMKGIVTAEEAARKAHNPEEFKELLMKARRVKVAK